MPSLLVLSASGKNNQRSMKPYLAVSLLRMALTA